MKNFTFISVAKSSIEVPGILAFKNLLSFLEVTGGSSTINYMVYARDNPTDYNEWVQEGLRSSISLCQIKKQISRDNKFN